MHREHRDRAQCRRGAAEGALDPEAAPEAQEIGRRAEMLVGHPSRTIFR